MLNYRIIFHFVFLVITGISNFGLSQVDDNDDFDNEPQNYERIKPHHSLSMEVGLPVAMRNSTFNAYMQGMVNISPYYHYSFKNKLTVGAGINYNYFWINHVLTPDPKNLGGIHALGGYARFGFETFHTNRFGIDLNVKIGKSHVIFDSDNNHQLPQLPTLNVFCIEPSMGFVITADEQSSYRWILGYGIQKYHFVPTYLGFDKSANPTNNGDNVNLFSRIADYTSYLTISFGYTYYFKQR